jgi:3D (Asp-Asp-Asp) domain-containing protein
MQIGQWDTTNNRIQSTGRNLLFIGTDAFNTIFSTNDAERLRITASGRLLLGTTTESTFLLDVNGTARVSGAATFSSSVTASSFIKSGGTSAEILAADGSVITAGTNITISGGTISSSGGGGSVDELQVALISQVYG